MSEPIVYVDNSQIRDGKLKALKTAMNDLVEFIEANESELIAYNVYLNNDNTRVTVINVHRDAASLEFHARVAGPLIPQVRGIRQALDHRREFGSNRVEIPRSPKPGSPGHHAHVRTWLGGGRILRSAQDQRRSAAGGVEAVSVSVGPFRVHDWDGCVKM